MESRGMFKSVAEVFWAGTFCIAASYTVCDIFERARKGTIWTREGLETMIVGTVVSFVGLRALHGEILENDYAWVLDHGFNKSL